MGYYTQHTLTVSDNDIMEHCERIERLSGYSELFEGESCKWYDHENNMRSYSKDHPKVLFTLEGEGEESGDIWKEYYKDGKMQRCKAKIMFDAFDEAQMS